MANASPASSGERLIEVWHQHVYSEFVMKDAKAALTTMTDDPYVLAVPIATGARGRDGVYNFYKNCFIPQIPDDITSVTISDVTGENILAEEAVYRFTHDRTMDWLVPGVPATGKRVELTLVAIIRFENGKIASEHIYWDHASLLVQLGLIDAAKVPAKGVESARTLLEWSGAKLAA